MSSFRVHNEYSIRHNQFRTLVARYDLRQRKSEYLSWNWLDVPEATIIPDECWLHQDEHESNAFLQAMLDLAWSRGLKPANYKDENPQLEAVKYHLEDMRSLVFKKEKP